MLLQKGVLILRGCVSIRGDVSVSRGYVSIGGDVLILRGYVNLKGEGVCHTYCINQVH